MPKLPLMISNLVLILVQEVLCGLMEFTIVQKSMIYGGMEIMEDKFNHSPDYYNQDYITFKFQVKNIVVMDLKKLDSEEMVDLGYY